MEKKNKIKQRCEGEKLESGIVVRSEVARKGGNAKGERGNRETGKIERGGGERCG